MDLYVDFMFHEKEGLMGSLSNGMGWGVRMNRGFRGFWTEDWA